jgi:hypothetical protein
MHCVDCPKLIDDSGDVLCPKTFEVLAARGEPLTPYLLEPCTAGNFPFVDHDLRVLGHNSASF